jgi:O-antigen/teichoic acid export membrane protein
VSPSGEQGQNHSPHAGDPLGQSFWLSKQWRTRTLQASAGIWTATLLSFLATIVAANALGAEQYGQLALAVSTVVLIITFLDVPLEEAVVHFGAKAIHAGDFAGLRSLLRSSLRLDIFLGTTVCGLAVIGASPLAQLVSKGQIDPLLVRLAALEALAWTADGSTGAILLLSGKAHLRGLATAWTNLLRLASVLVAVRVVGGVEAVLSALVTSSLVGAATQGLLAWRFGWRTWPVSDPVSAPVSVGRLARFGLNSGLGTSAVSLRLSLVSVALGRLTSPIEVGALNVATFPVTLSAVLSAPLRTAMFPEHAKLAAERKTHLLWKSVKGYTLISLALGLVGALVGWFVLPWLLPKLYGSGFKRAVLPARILLVAAVASLAVAWSKTLPAAIGRPGIRTLISIGELVATALVIVPLAHYGATGAASAISVVTIVGALLWWTVIRRMLFSATGQGIRSEPDLEREAE